MSIDRSGFLLAARPGGEWGWTRGAAPHPHRAPEPKMDDNYTIAQAQYALTLATRSGDQTEIARCTSMLIQLRADENMA